MEDKSGEMYKTIVSVNGNFGKHFDSNCRGTSLATTAKLGNYRTVQEGAVEIADDIVKYMIGSSPLKPTNEHSPTMTRVVSEISRRHELVFEGMWAKLFITDANVTGVLGAVLDEVFADGECNWGRLVTVYAFSGWVARHFARQGMPEYATGVGRTAGVYVATKLASWIENNGGWDGFEMFFAQPVSSEKFLLGGLICTIVSVGIGVLATALIAKQADC